MLFSPPHLHVLYLFALFFLLQLSKQTLKKLSKASAGKRGEGGEPWAVATVWLHPIRTGSVEKGRGLPAGGSNICASVPVPSAPTAFCRERQREGGEEGGSG